MAIKQKSGELFRGDLEFLSNFYEKEFYIPTFGKVPVKSGEHGFQALKTSVKSEQLKVLEAKTPKLSKAYGRKVTLRPDWDHGGRLSAMRVVIDYKFRVESLKEKLLETDGLLVEYNKWCDNYFGVCVCSKCDGKGKNILGELLMERRFYLRATSK